MPGPFVYPNVESLLQPDRVPDIAGNFMGECVSLVKRYIPALQNAETRTWKEGVNVIETLKNGGTIEKGTAIATFVNGKFESGHGHAAFYAGYYIGSDGDIYIFVVDQYLGSTPSNGVQKRQLSNYGRDVNDNWRRRSNNGRAFSVIML